MSRLPDGSGPRIVSEVRRSELSDAFSVWVHPEWTRRFPWMVQGVTGRGEAGHGDFALFRDGEAAAPPPHWEELARMLEFPSVVHSRQVHAAHVLSHGSVGSGLALGPPADGHVTSAPGVLMGVTVADCVPVYILEPDRKVGGLLHAGWRSAAAGILERAVELLARERHASPGAMVLHLGPSICGACYEVGPEVLRALRLPVPSRPTPVDLRGVLAHRARALGLPEEEITVSGHCTLCGDGPFFSHRGGEAERQVGFLGIRPSPGAGLCGRCAWSRSIHNRRGSRFLLCARSETDPDFPRYPRLPVLECGGFEEG